MKYERLTKRVDNYPKIKYCSKNCETISCVDCGCCDELDYALYRLAELEDKIENGTLVELPCKVGDEVYEVQVGNNVFEVNYKYGKVIEHKVSKVQIKSTIIVYWQDGKSNKDYGYLYNDIYFDTYLTKAEAEKRLEELQKEDDYEDFRAMALGYDEFRLPQKN